MPSAMPIVARAVEDAGVVLEQVVFLAAARSPEHDAGREARREGRIGHGAVDELELAGRAQLMPRVRDLELAGLQVVPGLLVADLPVDVRVAELDQAVQRRVGRVEAGARRRSAAWRSCRPTSIWISYLRFGSNAWPLNQRRARWTAKSCRSSSFWFPFSFSRAEYVARTWMRPPTVSENLPSADLKVKPLPGLVRELRRVVGQARDHLGDLAASTALSRSDSLRRSASSCFSSVELGLGDDAALLQDLEQPAVDALRLRDPAPGPARSRLRRPDRTNALRSMLTPPPGELRRRARRAAREDSRELFPASRRRGIRRRAGCGVAWMQAFLERPGTARAGYTCIRRRVWRRTWPSVRGSLLQDLRCAAWRAKEP